jgi:hypothetical protein
MKDLLYEKQGAYLQGKDDERNEVAKAMLAEGLPVEMISRVTKFPESTILKLKTQLEKTTTFT